MDGQKSLDCYRTFRLYQRLSLYAPDLPELPAQPFLRFGSRFQKDVKIRVSQLHKSVASK
jgi:hypothetical protein